MSCVIRRLFSAKLLHSSVSSPQLQQQQQRLQLPDLLAFKQPHTDPRPPSDTAYNYVANQSVVHKVKANRPNENNRIQALPDQLQCFNKHGNDRVPRKAPVIRSTSQGTILLQDLCGPSSRDHRENMTGRTHSPVCRLHSAVSA
jgi:hypothetical protein